MPEGDLPDIVGGVLNPSPRIKTLVAAGGVAANRAIRAVMEKLAADSGMTFVAPRLSLCTDNGAMIAWAGIENYEIGNITTEPFVPCPAGPWPTERGQTKTTYKSKLSSR